MFVGTFDQIIFGIYEPIFVDCVEQIFLPNGASLQRGRCTV